MIYVHSKLMIVDDQKMIIGSQNINDRSLLGSRDSEIGVTFLDDKEKIDVPFDSKKVTVSKFIHEYRLRLWNEHLQPQSPSEIVDPISSYTLLWLRNGRKNTEIYDFVFPAKPQNTVKTTAAYLQRQIEEPRETKRLAEISGRHILFPLDFLVDDQRELRHLSDDVFH